MTSRTASHTRPRLLATGLLVALTALVASLLVVLQAPAATALRCTITGTNGPDVLRGTSGGLDVICGLGGDDVLISGGGREDVLRGGSGDDRLESKGSTFAVLEGEGGNDRLVGGAGTDSLRGGSGRDVLVGGDGADGLHGGGGDDDLDGGPGNDGLRWDPGADSLRGGGGADYFGYADAPRRVEVSLDGAANDGTAGEGDDIGDDIERVLGSKYDDTMTGDDAANTLLGFDGDDLVVGGGGRDRLEGMNDRDELRGGPGGDTLVGGDSDDVLLGGDGADVLKGAGGNTQSSEHNVCDDDPADTISRCFRDSAGPVFYASPQQWRIAPGETFTFWEVLVLDDAGVESVDMVTTLDGVEVPWCTGPMDVLHGGTSHGRTIVNKECHAPADAVEGAYEIEFSATDRLGHFASSADVPRRTGFVVDTVPATGVAPEVTASVPASTYAPGDRVRVTVTISHPDGIVDAGIQLQVPGPSADYFSCPTSNNIRTSGTMTEGTWEYVCRLHPDRDPPSGTWTVDVYPWDTYQTSHQAPDVATFEVTG